MSPLGNKVCVERNTFSSWVFNCPQAPAAERTHGAAHIAGLKCSFCFKVICQCEHWPPPQPISLVLELKQWHLVLERAEQLVNKMYYWLFILVVCWMRVYINTAQSANVLMNCRSVFMRLWQLVCWCKLGVSYIITVCSNSHKSFFSVYIILGEQWLVIATEIYCVITRAVSWAAERQLIINSCLL